MATETTRPTMATNKLAMSKALGAAFLSHQVEQLEQKVSSGTGRGGGGNWKDGRRTQGYNGRGNEQGNESKRAGVPLPGGLMAGQKTQQRRNATGVPESDCPRRWRDDAEVDKDDKDADVIIIDASVLIHGITHLKRWCKDGRQEVVIIPLEALNTLDLLKKGASSLAQRARAASRILEAQVGANPRIRVQRDDAFVLWDTIPFIDTTTLPPSSPEWVRRTICCARWEIEHTSPQPRVPKIVLAVCTSDPDSVIATTIPPPLSVSPVPLPAPQPNKYEPRSTGTLVLQWATLAGIDVLGLTPGAVDAQGPSARGPTKEGSVGSRRSSEHTRRSSDDERGGGRGIPAGRGGHGRRHHHQQSKPLVERPPAVMAMMEAISQPKRVVRVLARGEKLDAN